MFSYIWKVISLGETYARIFSVKMDIQNINAINSLTIGSKLYFLLSESTRRDLELISIANFHNKRRRSCDIFQSLALLHPSSFSKGISSLKYLTSTCTLPQNRLNENAYAFPSSISCWCIHIHYTYSQRKHVPYI